MKTEKVVIQIFASIENISDINYHEEFLAKLEPILVKSMIGPRKPLRLRAGQFWNRTFGKKPDVPYSDDLKPVLTKYKAKLNLLLPALKGESEIKDIPLSTMDDTAQFPEYSQNTQNTASPKLKNKQITVPSPVKIHGSFLGKKSPKDPKKLGSPKAVLGNFLASGTTKNSPKSPFRNSPVKNVRRKLPINYQDDSSDFVVIKDSPATKKKRLLTEHQKEIMRERRELPAMYNALDNSQDTTLMRTLSQDHTQLTQDSTFRLIEKPEINPVEMDAETDMEHQSTTESVKAKQPVHADRVEIAEKSSNDEGVIESEEKVEEVINKQEKMNNDDENKDIVPSSQTQESQQSQTTKQRRKSILKSNTRDSMLLLGGLNGIIPVVDRKTPNKTVDSLDTEIPISEEELNKNAEIDLSDIELFDTETSRDKQQVITDKPEEEKVCDQTPDKIDDEEDTTKEPSSSQELNMEAQIVINKLPNKRKRSVPIAKRTDQQKKRKVAQDTISKENKIPPPSRTTRRSMGQTNRKTPTDVFDFSQEENKTEIVSLPVKKRGRPPRKSVPASFKLTTKKCLEQKTSDQVEDNTVPARPVPQIASLPTADKDSIQEIQQSSSESVGTDDGTNADKGVIFISETETESISSAVPQQELNGDVAENNQETQQQQQQQKQQPFKPDPLPLMTDSVTGALPLCSVSSPLPSSSKLVRNPFVNYSTCSPTQTAISYMPSPTASPVTSILKKRLSSFDCKDSPSPPNNVSHMSIHLIKYTSLVKF